MTARGGREGREGRVEGWISFPCKECSIVPNFLDYEVFLWLDEHTLLKEDLQNYPNIKIKNIKDGKIIFYWIIILTN